ncbi:POK6 protein, partial [Crotophaga sulcirostris]|nr:POK6 protein [Crotophaga sulcirostris]
VTHVTGIPHLSTGQAIVERANRTIKEYLDKQKNVGETDPQIRLNKVLFTLNYLSLAADLEQPPVVIHNSGVKMQAIPEIQLRYKNPATGLWEGP